VAFHDIVKGLFSISIEECEKMVWNEKGGRRRETKPLSSFLSEELMSSLEYNLSINRENNEKGAR